jgi:hypothetical protein
MNRSTKRRRRVKRCPGCKQNFQPKYDGHVYCDLPCLPGARLPLKKGGA